MLAQPGLAEAFKDLPFLRGGPHRKDYSIPGSILGSPVLGKCHVDLRS